nr:P-loop containing nucleoside triphosphate hydrolase [Tanacetum cinerariifolium]
RYHSPRGRELAIVRTLSLCRNAISHANESGPVKLLEPGFELDDQEWVKMGSFFFVRLEIRILLEKIIAAIKGYKGGSGG